MPSLISRLLSKTGQWTGLPIIDLSRTHEGDAKWHQDLIVHLVAITRPAVYVELGIYKCGLFNRVASLVGEAIGVDANPQAGRYMVGRPNARFFAASTAEFIRRLEAQPLAIDMLFIDADHSKEAVEADFLGCLPFVKPHGLILLHDTHPQDVTATGQERCGDAYQAIEKLSRQTSAFEMMTVPVHPGLTLCRKRTTQLSWAEPQIRGPTYL